MAKIDKKYEESYIPLDINNVEIQWSHLITPDTAFGGNKWCVDLILPDNLAADMEAAGFNLKALKDKDGKVISKNVVTAKKEVSTSKGTNEAPLLYGPKGETGWDKEPGNGSICNVKCTAKKWAVSNTITLYIEKLQVVNYVVRPDKSEGFGDTTGTGEDVPF